jgi:CysZ protein
MIFNAARLSLANLFASETRGVFWKVIGLTVLALVVLWFALRESFVAFAWPWLQAVMMPDVPEWAGWLTLVFGVVASLGLALMLALLLAPVTAIIAGFFLDDVAEVIEKRDYPTERPGEALPMGQAISGSIKFLGVNLVAFFLVNGYLLGREFFEFAAMRYRTPAEARLFRAKHGSTVLLAGLLIAAFLAIPFVNLLTPLFAAGLMVHLHKALSRKDPAFSLGQN